MALVNQPGEPQGQGEPQEQGDPRFDAFMETFGRYIQQQDRSIELPIFMDESYDQGVIDWIASAEEIIQREELTERQIILSLKGSLRGAVKHWYALTVEKANPALDWDGIKEAMIERYHKKWTGGNPDISKLNECKYPRLEGNMQAFLDRFC